MSVAQIPDERSDGTVGTEPLMDDPYDPFEPFESVRLKRPRRQIVGAIVAAAILLIATLVPSRTWTSSPDQNQQPGQPSTTTQRVATTVDA